jgi:lambda family phage portal protein
MGQYDTLNRRGFVLPSRLSNSYDGGSATGSRTRNWQPSSAGPNSVAASQLPLLRRRARAAVKNDPWAKATIARLVSNTIGTGIQPYPQHPDKVVRSQLKELWNDWIPESDADGRLDFYGQQTLAARALFQDGESLARLRLRRPEDGLSVPLQVQLMAADHLPSEKNESVPGGGAIVNGVEFNAIGGRAAYHLWALHPGEYARPASTSQQLRRVPAEQIVHTYQMLEPGQVRGIPELATVLLRLKSLDNFDDAVLFRQEVANLFAGFITSPEPKNQKLDPLTGQPVAFDRDGYTPIASLEPGSMQELLPGEEVEFSTPPDAGPNYEAFMRQQLMAAFASVGVPYEIVSGDLRGISDRVLRVIVNEFHRSIEQIQWTTFIHQFCRPIWSAWMDSIALSGVLLLPDYYRNRRLYQRVRWVPQGWPYFNPVQDIKAKKDQVRAGFKSRTSVKLEQGDDPDAVDTEIANENTVADEQGLVFDSDPRRTSSNGAAVQQTLDEGNQE